MSAGRRKDLFVPCQPKTISFRTDRYCYLTGIGDLREFAAPLLLCQAPIELQLSQATLHDQQPTHDVPFGGVQKYPTVKLARSFSLQQFLRLEGIV